MQRTTYCANRERNWSVQINFPGKPDRATIDRLKKMGLTFAPSESAWIKRGHWVGSDITAFLAEIGATKVDDIERESLSFGERLEAKQEAAEERGERLENAADKAQSEADRRFGTARHCLDGIEPGQPILVGHHSEGRHRRALERHDANMGKGIEAENYAKDLAARAASAGVNLEGYDRPEFLARRIKEAEAELRKIERNRAQWIARKPVRDAFLSWKQAGGVSRTDPGFDWEWGWLLDSGYDGDRSEDPLATSTRELQSKLDYCRERLAELGGLKFSPQTIAKGSVIVGNFGLGYVKRANPTTVSVVWLTPAIFTPKWPSKSEYGHIKECRTAAETVALLEAELAKPGDNSQVAKVLANLQALTAAAV